MLANFPGNFVDVSLNSTETRAAPSTPAHIMRGMTCEGTDCGRAKFLQIPLLHNTLPSFAAHGNRRFVKTVSAPQWSENSFTEMSAAAVRVFQKLLFSSLPSNLGGRYKLYSHNIVSELESSLPSPSPPSGPSAEGAPLPSSFGVYSSFYRNAFCGQGLDQDQPTRARLPAFCCFRTASLSFCPGRRRRTSSGEGGRGRTPRVFSGPPPRRVGGGPRSVAVVVAVIEFLLSLWTGRGAAFVCLADRQGRIPGPKLSLIFICQF